MDRAAELFELGSATLGESGATPLQPGLVPVWSGARLAAPALTVRCAAGDNLAVHHAVASASPGQALVVVVDGGPEHGWWGEVLTVAAQTRGVAGLVIDACVRDTAAVERRRFPLWSAGRALPGASKVTRGVLAEPIEIRGADLSTGDWVVADGDGIVVIPAARVDEVQAAGRARADREAHLFDELLRGRTTVELLGLEPPAG